jgi:phosphoribosyl-dephospho-CoA transferase
MNYRSRKAIKQVMDAMENHTAIRAVMEIETRNKETEVAAQDKKKRPECTCELCKLIAELCAD